MCISRLHNKLLVFRYPKGQIPDVILPSHTLRGVKNTGIVFKMHMEKLKNLFVPGDKDPDTLETGTCGLSLQADHTYGVEST